MEKKSPPSSHVPSRRRRSSFHGTSFSRHLRFALHPRLAAARGGQKIARPDVVFKGHTDAVYATAFSPDGKFLVTASFDSTLKLWDPATGKEVRTYGGALGHAKQVISVAFNQDGSMIASGSTDNTLKVWDVPISSPIRSLKANDAVQAVALSPDGLKLALGGKDGSLKLVTPADFKELVKFEPGHQGAVTALSFSANGLLLASSGTDRTLRYWDVAKGQLAPPSAPIMAASTTSPSTRITPPPTPWATTAC